MTPNTELYCLDCQRAANTECVEKGHKMITPNDGGEWRVDDKYIMQGGQQIGRFTTSELAVSAVAAHNSIPLLREALYEARGLACEQTWSKDKADAKRANNLVAQIDAALESLNTKEPQS